MSEDRPVFVFGSNLAGRHGLGAALHARVHYGARIGVGEGPTGRAYALPTKDHDLHPRSLPDIRRSVDTFLAYARANPEQTFAVTRVGCGLAGYRDQDIAPFFAESPPNCILPSEWRLLLGSEAGTSPGATQ